MKLPQVHPQRLQLNNEVHARPPMALHPNQRLSYLALMSDPAFSEQEWRRVRDLAEHFGKSIPHGPSNHCRIDMGPFQLTFERHAEFARYTIVADGVGDNPFDNPALALLPEDWVAQLPGQLMVATHAAVVPAPSRSRDYDRISKTLFDGNTLIGAMIGGGAGTALTDMRVRGDGFSRLLIEDRSMTARQAGRYVQRLLEIDTYRIMALLALPVAQHQRPFLQTFEQELEQVTTAMASAQEKDEPVLLDRLTRLAAEIEHRYSASHFRFSAASAYYALVENRIDELREERLPGLQTFGEFTARRLEPAMNTCQAIAARHEALSERMARATQLLSTRVEITSERQSQALLESMDRRAKLQLRLQQTVEGLSIAAITYYVVGLVGYAAKGLNAMGLGINSDLVMGLSIPAVAILAWFGIGRLRRWFKDSKP
ncbi:MAG: DUF3422 family protein [Alphaproteobacteria bacterium]